MGSSGRGWVRKFSMVCLHNNAIVARGILVTILHCGTPEPRLSAIYVVSSVETSMSLIIRGLARNGHIGSAKITTGSATYDCLWQSYVEAKGLHGGEYERGFPPLIGGGCGGPPPRKF